MSYPPISAELNALIPEGAVLVPVEEIERLSKLEALLAPFIRICNTGGPEYDEQTRLYWNYDRLCAARKALAINP